MTINYYSKFNLAIIRNVNYWTKYSYVSTGGEAPNILRAIEVALISIENSEIVEILIMNHFYWIENESNLGRWIQVLGEYSEKFENHPKVSKWIIHFWSILLWKEKHYKKSIQVNIKLNSSNTLHDQLLRASTNYQIGRGYWAINQLGLAEKYSRLSLAAIEKVSGNNYLFGMIKNLLGMIYSQHGKSKEAINLFNAAEEYYLAENITHLMGESFHNISKEYQKNGKYKLALVYYGKAAQQKYNQQSWEGLGEIEFSRALLYYKLGRLKNALDAFKRGVSISNKFQPLPLNQGWISLVRGYMYLLQGNNLLAKSDFIKSMELWENLGRKDLIEYSEEAINLTN